MTKQEIEIRLFQILNEEMGFHIERYEKSVLLKMMIDSIDMAEFIIKVETEFKIICLEEVAATGSIETIAHHIYQYINA
jgi:acyl carrier protein